MATTETEPTTKGTNGEVGDLEAKRAAKKAAPFEPPTQEEAEEQLKLLSLEGHKATVLALSIAGRYAVKDQELADAVRLGKEIELVVSARVVGRGLRLRAGRKGEGEKVIAATALQVTEVRLSS